jgi:two-component system, LytTR family, sensor kinase
MRYEDGFELVFPPAEAVDGAQLPPMSLQLLVENALKHNSASVHDPLRVEIRLAENYLEARNKTLDPRQFYRVNRQLLVNIEAIRRVHTWLGGG